MSSGIKILHRIDTAIAKARNSVAEAAELPLRAEQALLNLQRQKTEAMGQIARDRLDIISDGEGGDLGYVDRQASKLLGDHDAAMSAMQASVAASQHSIESLEKKRRAQEAATAKAIDGYDKAAARAETLLLKDPGYNDHINEVERLEATTARAEEKLAIAQEDEEKKGAPYREDPFFSYLQERRYGTEDQKGWFLTRWLDGGVARLTAYRQTAENYRRLTAIPHRLQLHCERLEAGCLAAQNSLQTFEANWLVSQGVSGKHTASLTAQKELEAIDADIEKAETLHAAKLTEAAEMTSGHTGPYKAAQTLMAETLAKQKIGQLRHLAAQTRTREDDKAVETLKDLSGTEAELLSDQKTAQRLLKDYQARLTTLESVRRNFKARRYDAPNSSFKRPALLMSLIGQVLQGGCSGKDLWTQIERAQRTIKRYSDTDFGGIDWTEGLRLPRSPRRTGRSGQWGGNSGGIDIGDIFGSGGIGGGGWGGGGGSRRTRRRPRTSIPRSPRIKLPKSGGFGGGFKSGRRGGGFKTGGGF